MALTPDESALLSTLANDYTKLKITWEELLAVLLAAGGDLASIAASIATHNADGAAHALAIAAAVATHNTSQNAHAALFGTKIRKQLTVGTTIYLRTTGNDANDGRSAATAFATVARLTQELRFLDCAGYILTIDVGPGTWPVLHFVTGIPIGANGINVFGSGMGNCIIDGGGSGWAISNRAPGLPSLAVRGFKFTNYGIGLHTAHNCRMEFQDVDFSTQGAAGSQIHVGDNSRVQATGNYRISAGGTRHVAVGLHGVFSYNGVTIDIQNTPAFGQFTYVNPQGVYFRGSGAYTGIATGPRVVTLAGSQLFLNGAGVDSLPGSTTGTIDPTTIIS